MKIIDEWKQAWRWYSVNCPALAVALLGAWAALPEAMQSTFSPGELKAAAIFLIALGIGGRFVDQKPKQDADQCST